MATQAGGESAVGRDGAAGGTWTGSDTRGAGGSSSVPASLGRAGAGVVAALAARPSLVVGIVAIALGALIGNWLATRFPRRSAAVEMPDLPSVKGAGRTSERARDQAQAAVSLIPLAVRLLSNPVVRYYLRRALARQVAQTFGR